MVVGGGLAGAKTVEALREKGYDGALTLIAGENELPYERPPMSKGYLAGDDAFDDAVVHSQAWYAEHDVDLRIGTTVTAIDRTAHTVTLDKGEPLAYDKLVLATGSQPRHLPIDGADAGGVHYLRTRADSDALREQFGPDKALVIIGAGWIGLEVAAAARGKDTAVTVLEGAAQPLLAVLGPEIAPVFAQLHRDNGVDLRLEVKVDGIEVRDGQATGVRLVGGEVVAADAVVIGVGAAPNLDLAKAAGLDVDGGVLVDATLRSSDPDIYAVGDIASHDHPVLGRRIRVEHWATALNQPAAAAAAILGEGGAYEELPYFFSDQYDLGMEYIGNAPSYDQVVVRGDKDAREFVAFWLDDQRRIVAAMNVNVWDVIDEIKPLILDAVVVDPVKLADPDVAYGDLR
ncbi:FAD-dependent oxidoreductase [Calidifontibacter terrae]